MYVSCLHVNPNPIDNYTCSSSVTVKVSSMTGNVISSGFNISTVNSYLKFVNMIQF